jgi:RNA-binding protein YlmH
MVNYTNIQYLYEIFVFSGSSTAPLRAKEGIMDDSERRLMNRLEELAERAQTRGCYVYSEFLNTAEQAIFCRIKTAVQYSFFGGYEAAERKIARFGDPADLGYDEAPPIDCLCISPLSQKFADTLTHRDFLGALMSLGIRRELLGDIIIDNNCGFLFCLGSIAVYISEQLTEVRRTSVRCERSQPPAKAAAVPEAKEFSVASERLDAVIAAVFKLSRADSQSLFVQGKVFVCSRATEDVSRQLAQGDIVSVRGLGRFLYGGVLRETRKGRLYISASVY